MRGFLQASCIGALFACAAGSGCLVVSPASAQGSYSPYDESPAAALARYVRTLAQSPKDFQALIGAGRSALELGDAQAAAGFFARADEVNPRSPLPQAGMGAVQVANGDARAAMAYFTRAQQLGASAVTLGCDRGLAYDMLGQQALAQADYRAALSSADADEARRRLALSLAISGDKAGALGALAPLSAKGDATTARVRAFVLALTGDSRSAMAAIDAAMPGSWARVAPFLQRLPTLAAGDKAAAVNLGIFPDGSAPAATYASIPQAQQLPSTNGVVSSVSSGDRLAGIDALLGGSSSAADTASPSRSQPPLQSPAERQAQPVQVAYNLSRPAVQSVQRPVTAAQRKIWIQLASGHNPEALYGEFRRLKAKNKDIFNGIKPYVARTGERARLVIGPFRGQSDADILTDDLQTVGIDAFKWSNSETEQVVPLATE